MSKVICPVCHKFDINFSGGATYNITSDYKLLPGAKLTVDSGATLNIQKKLLIYSDNIYSATYNGQPVTTASSMWAENSTPRAAAELCVNGTLNVTGGIAGKITTGKTGAKLNLSNASTLSVSSDEGNGTGMYSYTKIYTESSEANGVLGMSAGKAVNANMAKANYYSVNYGNGVYGWAQYSITYDWVYSGTKYSLDNFKNNITNNNPAVYSTTASVVLTIPTLTTTEPYFDGWYTDAACTTPINKIDGLSGNITIYGKWVDEITYDVNFVTNVGCGNVDVTVNTYKMPEGNFNPYNYEIAKSAVNAVRYDATATHYFEGWYTTSDFTTKVSETSGISISSDTTLYAKWITKSKVTITSGSGYVTGINATTDGTTFTVDKSMAANGFYLVPGSTVAITAQYQHSGAASGLVGPATYKAKVEIAANGQTATVGKDSKTSASKYHTVTASATATTNWTISNDTEVTITTANDY